MTNKIAQITNRGERGEGRGEKTTKRTFVNGDGRKLIRLLCSGRLCPTQPFRGRNTTYRVCLYPRLCPAPGGSQSFSPCLVPIPRLFLVAEAIISFPARTADWLTRRPRPKNRKQNTHTTCVRTNRSTQRAEKRGGRDVSNRRNEETEEQKREEVGRRR